METVGPFEANDTLSGLLDRVEKGEEVVITRQGKPIAKLVQLEETAYERRERARRLIDEILEARQGLTIHPYTWKELRDEGRK